MIERFTGENLDVHRTIVGEGDNEKEIIRITQLDTGEKVEYTFQEWNEIFEVVMMMDAVIQRDRNNSAMPPIHMVMGQMGGENDPS